MKKNTAFEVELVDIYLDQHRHPLAFKVKLHELMESGMSEQEAKSFLMTNPIQMELYYSKDQGLFMIETDAVESTTIYNPYDGKQMEEFDEDE